MPLRILNTPTQTPSQTPAPTSGGFRKLEQPQSPVMVPNVNETVDSGGGFGSFLKDTYNAVTGGMKKFATGVANTEIGAFKGVASTIGSVSKNILSTVGELGSMPIDEQFSSARQKIADANIALVKLQKQHPIDSEQYKNIGGAIKKNQEQFIQIGGDQASLNAYTQGLKDTPDFLKPTTTGQKVGYALEKTAEFLIPGGTIKRGEEALKTAVMAKNLAPGYTNAIRIIGGSLMEGLSSLGVTAAQGGDLNDMKNAGFWGTVLAVPFKALSVFKDSASSLLKESANKKVSQALGATTKENKILAEKVTPGLLDKKVTFLTRNGLATKADANILTLGDNIDEAWNNLPENTKVVVTPIMKKLEEAKQSLVIKGTDSIAGSVKVPEAAMERYQGLQSIQKEILSLTGNGPKLETAASEISNHINTAKQILQEMPNAPLSEVLSRTKINIVDSLKAEGLKDIASSLDNIDPSKFTTIDDLGKAVNDAILDNQSISAQTLRSFRQIIDKVVGAKTKLFGITGSESEKMMVNKSGANAIRNALNDDFPDIARLNAEFSFWQNVKTVIGATIDRTKSQGTPIQETIAEGAGAITGMLKGGKTLNVVLGALGFKYFKAAITSPAWRMTSAIMRNSLADALMSGNAEKVLEISRRLLVGMGVTPPSETK